MHQALYRKWRSRTFDDVCGQEHVTSVLKYEVAHGTINHAYLFCGSRGIGKTTCAKILAKAVNCEHPQNGNPCGKCAACLAIENGTATDVLEMDAASNNGVGNIRDIRDEVIYSPSTLKYRVYIVDEVHMLTANAFNALLKTLEEPPAHVVFILATTELQKLPATIISRCQRFDFRRISVPVLAARVTYIAEQEHIGITKDAAIRIARMAQGGMRDAISLLELCGSTGRPVDVATVEEMTGAAGREEMLRVLRAVIDGDYNTIFSIVAENVSAARDLTVFWQDLMSIYRDLLVVKTTDAATQYLDLTDTETAALTAIAATIPRARLLAHCKLLEDAYLAMTRAGNVKRMIAELTLVRLCDPALDTSPEGILARLEKLEETAVSGARAPAVAAPVEQKPTEPPKKAPEPTLPKQMRLRGFADCIERVRRENMMIASFLETANAFSDENGKITVCLTNSMAPSMMEQHNGKELLRRALSATLGREIAEGDLRLELTDPNTAKGNEPLDDLFRTSDEQTNA